MNRDLPHRLVHRHPLELTVDDEAEEKARDADDEAEHEKIPAANSSQKTDAGEIGNDEVGLPSRSVGFRACGRLRNVRGLLSDGGGREKRSACQRHKCGENDRYPSTEQWVHPDPH